MSDVDKLWELQSVLTQLNDREKQMSVEPESYASVNREYTAAKEEIARLDEQLEALAKERRRVEGELSDQQELLKKYQGQLMQVKNQQQYAAAWKEIDATRKHVKELEESDLKNMGEAEGLQKQRDERTESSAGLQVRHDAEYAAWQASLTGLRKEAGQLRDRVAKVEASIPDPLKREFHRIYKQRNHIGVAIVTNDTCSACRTRIRPALAQQLKRGEMVHCEGCHRILYLEKTS